MPVDGINPIGGIMGMNAAEIETLLGLPALSLTVSTGTDGKPIFTPPLTRGQAEKLRRAQNIAENPPTNDLERIEREGFLTSFGVRFGCGDSDQAQWVKLNTHLDLAHDALAKSSNKTWEQVRRDFEAQPIKVQTYDGTVWSTTIGDWRSAFLELTGAYLAAWSSQYQ